MATALIALPERDFDPTEAAVPWKRLREAGHAVHFTTPGGRPARCDSDMLEGVFFRQIRALPDHASMYAEMTQDAHFQDPMPYTAVSPSSHDLLVLPGGHAQGMRPYLEDADLQAAVLGFMSAGSTVGAICHGTVVLARTHDHNDRSVLEGRHITTLPKRFEMGAWVITKPYKGDYFRTYPTWVEDEVRAALGPDGTCAPGPFLPLHGAGFVVEDGNLITARWPGDAERFAAALVARLG